MRRIGHHVNTLMGLKRVGNFFSWASVGMCVNTPEPRECSDSLRQVSVACVLQQSRQLTYLRGVRPARHCHHVLIRDAGRGKSFGSFCDDGRRGKRWRLFDNMAESLQWSTRWPRTMTGACGVPAKEGMLEEPKLSPRWLQRQPQPHTLCTYLFGGLRTNVLWLR